MKPLTAEEIAELRASLTPKVLREMPRQLYRALPRLLDEVERSRALLDLIEWSGGVAQAHRVEWRRKRIFRLGGLP